MTIQQEIVFKCKAQLNFDALTQAEQFSSLTGSTAEMDMEPGGTFSCFDGMIFGMNIESISGKRLVQAWRVGSWDPGVYSLVKFELEEINALETKLIFDHTGFPEEHRVHLEQGWHDRYWDPIKKYLHA